MVGCLRCKQFGLLHLPFESRKFRRMLQRYRVTCGSFHDLMLEYLHPRTKIRICDCCGDGKEWFYEPGLHFSGAGPECRIGNAKATPAEIILITNQIHPLYWEYAMTGDGRYDLGLPDSDSPYFGPGGNAWEKTSKELAALKR